MKIAPSIYNAGIKNVDKTLREIEESGTNYLHVDIMDNHFVPNLSFGPGVIQDLNNMSNLILDVHLMIENPENTMFDYIEAGADIITVHYEATKHLFYVLQAIKKAGKKAGVAINPATSVGVIEPVLGVVDQVLVMTVNPGRKKETFIDETLKKVKELKKIKNNHNYTFDIQVDGNITNQNIKKVSQAGADIAVSGGYIFNGNGIKENIVQLMSE